MKANEARRLLTSRFLNAFDSLYYVAVTNIRNDPPDIPVEWMRYNILFNEGNQDTLGRQPNRRFIKIGLITIQVFTPMNKGTNLNDTICELVQENQDAITLDELWTYNGRIQTVGNDGEYYQQNVVVEFEFQDTR